MRSRTNTPAGVNKTIRRLCALLQLPASPVFVPVRPQPDSRLDDCFTIVPALIEREGGRQRIGWTLWEWPGVFAEAEFHTVWESPSGELVDVTPKRDPTPAIMFLEDPRRRYEGRRVDNVRLAVRSDSLAEDLIAVDVARFEVMNRGERASQYLVTVDRREIEPLWELKEVILQMMHGGLHRNSPCACGSGVKYKRCHGTYVPR